MRHRTPKYKQKSTRKNPNKDRITDVHANVMDNSFVKKSQNQARPKP